jgi:amino acid transporter
MREAGEGAENGLRQASLGAIEAFGFSLSIIAPTVGMAFTTPLTAQWAGRATPLAYLIGGVAMTLVGASFVAFCRRIAHAGSVYAYVGSVLGARCGFIAGWMLLLAYATFFAGSTALTGNFAAAALAHLGLEGAELWLILAFLGTLVIIWLAWRDIRIATRLMLVLEGISVLAILLLAAVILARAPLSLTPLAPDPDHGWAGIGYGLVFAVLAFAGFEGAATLGEESRNPRGAIPKVLIGTVIAATAFYGLVSYAQIVGYGLGNVAALAQASAPLDELATRYISGAFAGFFDVAVTVSSLACAIGCLSAAARILYALSRAGLTESFAEIDARHGTPAHSLLAIGAASIVSLFLLGTQSDAMSYGGDIVTVGTLALILVYIAVTAAQAVDALRSRRPTLAMIGSFGAALLLWPLWNSLYPVPPWPGNIWPYIVVAWLGLGVLTVVIRPSVARVEAPVSEAAE